MFSNVARFDVLIGALIHNMTLMLMNSFYVCYHHCVDMCLDGSCKALLSSWLERWPQPQLTCLRCWVHQAKLIGVVLGSIARLLNSNVWFSAGILRSACICLPLVSRFVHNVDMEDPWELQHLVVMKLLKSNH